MQIALFVIPLCVVVGWIIDKPMDLDFHIFETVTLLCTIFIVAVTLQDGKSHWLKGLMLILTYVCLAAAYWSHSDPKSMAN